jgi:hypothetical protein
MIIDTIHAPERGPQSLRDDRVRIADTNGEMEAVPEQFEMPRELQRPGPRPIKRRRGSSGGCVMVFGRLFILPHTIIGIGMLFMVPLTMAEVLFGDVHQGRIVKKWTTTGEDTSYHIGYEYDADGMHRKGDRTCSRSQYSAINDPARNQTPQSVKIRSLHLGRHWHVALLPGESGWGKVVFYLIFGTFWNGIVAVFVYVLWIAPWREKQLYRRGTPVPGRIYAKRTESGEDTSYYLDYEFIQPQLGMQRKKQSVTSDRFNQANEGQLVTILCYPNKTSPTAIYEYGDFVCT